MKDWSIHRVQSCIDALSPAFLRKNFRKVCITLASTSFWQTGNDAAALSRKQQTLCALISPALLEVTLRVAISVRIANAEEAGASGVRRFRAYIANSFSALRTAAIGIFDASLSSRIALRISLDSTPPENPIQCPELLPGLFDAIPAHRICSIAVQNNPQLHHEGVDVLQQAMQSLYDRCQTPGEQLPDLPAEGEWVFCPGQDPTHRQLTLAGPISLPRLAGLLSTNASLRLRHLQLDAFEGNAQLSSGEPTHLPLLEILEVGLEPDASLSALLGWLRAPSLRQLSLTFRDEAVVPDIIPFLERSSKLRLLEVTTEEPIGQADYGMLADLCARRGCRLSLCLTAPLLRMENLRRISTSAPCIGALSLHFEAVSARTIDRTLSPLRTASFDNLTRLSFSAGPSLDPEAAPTADSIIRASASWYTINSLLSHGTFPRLQDIRIQGNVDSPTRLLDLAAIIYSPRLSALQSLHVSIERTPSQDPVELADYART